MRLSLDVVWSLEIRKFSFAHSVINIWSSLDDCVVACNSINGFKKDKLTFEWSRVFISFI